ncbi:Uncharacterised protein [Mycobacteroides abscessus subsp. massiliense]|nr:Uncharacterised protein [Mycobacteroides abscessus subsp. massiliense]
MRRLLGGSVPTHRHVSDVAEADDHEQTGKHREGHDDPAMRSRIGVTPRIGELHLRGQRGRARGQLRQGLTQIGACVPQPQQLILR